MNKAEHLWEALAKCCYQFLSQLWDQANPYSPFKTQIRHHPFGKLDWQIHVSVPGKHNLVYEERAESFEWQGDFLAT